MLFPFTVVVSCSRDPFAGSQSSPSWIAGQLYNLLLEDIAVAGGCYRSGDDRAGAYGILGVYLEANKEGMVC